MNILNDLPSKKRGIIIGVLFLLNALTLIPFPWNTPLENLSIDWRFKVRGCRSVPDDIVLVFVGPEDLQALGGWPLTRDYYGYFLHVLGEQPAQVIGLDLLFNTPDQRYPEYDQRLADFMETTRPIVLPMVYSDLNSRAPDRDNFPPNVLQGENPLLPLPRFRHALSGLGFSNLGDESLIRKLPLIAAEGDSFRLSFGAELARVYLGIAPDSVTVTRDALIFNQKHAVVRRIPLDDAGQLYLNPFGTPQNLKAISLVELLQTFSKNPDSLQFRNKLIFLAVTAPGIAFLKTTPLTNVLPAALLHLTVAENIIFQNYLCPVKFIWAACLGFLLCLLIWLGVATEKNEKIIGLKSLGILGSYWLIAVLLFIAARLVLPLFYPTLLGAGVLVFSVLYYLRQGRQVADLQKVQLFKEIQQKQAKLTATEGLLQNLQTEIARTTEENVALNQQRQAEIMTLNSQIQTLQQEIADLEIFPLSEPEPGPLAESDIIYAPHSKMQSVLTLIEKIRQDDIPVLILGETGTGKEMIARAIHHTSSRHRNHFIAINCGALPETLLESELFGHEKGSYTGAVAPRRGRFELADGGTLFLDEITETSPNFQAKLLRVLQEGTFERLGSEKTLSVSVRIIAASNQNLSDQVEAGKFRVDLYYRLNGFPIQLPPLRERIEDIPLLSRHFLKKHGYQTIQNFSSAAMALLLKYPWPGNVRELENAVRRAAILARSENRRIIQIQHLPLDIRDFQPVTVVPAYLTLEDQILAALRQRQFSHTAIQETATALGNRDRGTITEYFRGICFQYLVENQFDHAAAARQIAGGDNVESIRRVQKKLEAYLKHLKSRSAPSVPGEIAESPAFKGLPQKYHSYLIQILDHLKSAD